MSARQEETALNSSGRAKWLRQRLLDDLGERRRSARQIQSASIVFGSDGVGADRQSTRAVGRDTKAIDGDDAHGCRPVSEGDASGWDWAGGSRYLGCEGNICPVC